MHSTTAAGILIGAAMCSPPPAAGATTTIAAAATTVPSLPTVPEPYIPPAAVATVRERWLATETVAKCRWAVASWVGRCPRARSRRR